MTFFPAQSNPLYQAAGCKQKQGADSFVNALGDNSKP
jgi:hypothetical protein